MTELGGKDPEVAFVVEKLWPACRVYGAICQVKIARAKPDISVTRDALDINRSGLEEFDLLGVLDEIAKAKGYIVEKG